MKIGINESVMERLCAQKNEHPELYLNQLKLEGHEVDIVPHMCDGLDIYITDKSEETALPNLVKYVWFFPAEVDSWWRIYHDVRYEVDPARL